MVFFSLGCWLGLSWYSHLSQCNSLKSRIPLSGPINYGIVNLLQVRSSFISSPYSALCAIFQTYQVWSMVVTTTTAPKSRYILV